MKRRTKLYQWNDERVPNAQYKYLYRKMLDEETIRKAWKELRKGKTKRKSVQNIDSNFDEEVRKMREMIRNTKPKGYRIDRPDLTYCPPAKRITKIVNERGKRRKANIADIREQWYFHIIVIVLKPIVLKRISKHSCGSIPKRGAHSGKRYLESAIRKGDNVRYFLKTDIRHFYDNLRIDIVIRELRKDIADELFLYCISRIYMYVPKGILIGLYISPWLANYVLCRLDHIIERTMNTTSTRYMDDVSVFANSKKMLFALLRNMKIELGRLRLRLKRTYQVCRFDYRGKGRPLDFMGFLFFRNKTVMRKKIMLSATRSARMFKRAKEKGRRFYIKAIRGYLSRIGWLKHTDSYNCYKKHIKPYVNIGVLKAIVSRIDKEGAEYGNMENRNLFGEAC